MQSHRLVLPLAALVMACTPPAFAQGVRHHTRTRNQGMAVTERQASALTLTLTEVSIRPIQAWTRVSGRVDGTGRVLKMNLSASEAVPVRVGQRLRCFSIAFRSQMHQGRISRITPSPSGAVVEGVVADDIRQDGERFIVEIVVDRGDYLSVPNASIIEEGDSHVVYVRQPDGKYAPKAVQTGIQGELYTQILGGLNGGEQVVSIGSFFIDAETKLKSPGAAGGAMAGMDHSSMPGMDHSSMPGMDHGR